MEEIKQAIKDLELQLNYICYDPVMIKKLSPLWDKLETLQEVVNKNNLLSDVSNRRELLIKFCDALFTQSGTQITDVQIDFLIKKFNL